MECIPAIDILGGRCVRLVRGEYDAVSDFGDPLERGLELAAQGATRLHVVDLDGARAGELVNAEVIGALVGAVAIPVQVGGGVREKKSAAQLLGLGADRVVVGTAALEDRALLEELVAAFPGRVVVGLDHRRASVEGKEQRVVATRGWTTTSAVELGEALSALSDLDLAGVLVTDITADGTSAGPDLPGYELALAASAHGVIASGGVGSGADLTALAGLSVDGRSLAGVVVGRAILSGTLSVAEAQLACAP